MEENDVNSPSAESIIRQILYGNAVLPREFGKTSAEYMLPDCFGFPASLPSILAPRRHQGLLDPETVGELAARSQGGRTRFAREDARRASPSTSASGKGPMARVIVAALNPGGYGSRSPTT